MPSMWKRSCDTMLGLDQTECSFCSQRHLSRSFLWAVSVSDALCTFCRSALNTLSWKKTLQLRADKHKTFFSCPIRWIEGRVFCGGDDKSFQLLGDNNHGGETCGYLEQYNVSDSNHHNLNKQQAWWWHFKIVSCFLVFFIKAKKNAVWCGSGP